MRKAFICPPKYVQGENELLNLGYFVKTFGKSALMIAHSDDVSRMKEQLEATKAKFDITIVETNFSGECSRKEIAKLKKLSKEHCCDCTIGLGGGKAIDTAKCVAEGKSLIIVPTIAATDAATSHSAVIYTDDGAFDGYAYFKFSPSVVLVDTTIIANAPTRLLVSGMGDALATYFEARATAASSSNVNSGLLCGEKDGPFGEAKASMASMALATLCYETLLKDGLKAKLACDNKIVTGALENIIEANVLLSGLGFESGGLAAAHAVHDGLTILDASHEYYHGEKVAFGTLAQLMLENSPMEEIEEVLDFCLSVGLPVCLEDIGVTSISKEQLMAVAEKTCIPGESIHSMPFPVTPKDVAAAIMAADSMGKLYKKESS